MGQSIGYGSSKFIAMDALISNFRARGYSCEIGSDHGEHYVYFDGYGTYQFIFVALGENSKNIISASITRIDRNKIEDYFSTDLDLLL